MSILFEKNPGVQNNDSYNPSTNTWINAVVAGIADLGKIQNKRTGKMVDKISVMFVLDEPLDDGRLKTYCQSYTASLYTEAALYKLSSQARWELGEEPQIADLLGKQVRFKFEKKDKYFNITNIDSVDSPTDKFPGDKLNQIHIPKFWAEDKEGNKLNYEFIVMDGVKKTTYQKKENYGDGDRDDFHEQDLPY